MARLTSITVKGKNQLGVTIDESVGVGGTNDFRDVLLIQVMLSYLITGKFWHFEPSEPPAPPFPSGICDQPTIDAISYYQRTRSHMLLKSDGRIDPPSYGKIVKGRGGPTWVGRNLVELHNKLMTMTLMHFESKKVAKYVNYEPHYLSGLRSIFPALESYMEGRDLAHILK